MTANHFMIGTLRCVQQGLYTNTNEMKQNALEVINNVEKPSSKDKIYPIYMFFYSLSNGYYNKYNHIKKLAHKTLKTYLKRN